MFFANKPSLNLLQDRLACVSELSLKGVIVTNNVVNYRAKSAQKGVPTIPIEYGGIHSLMTSNADPTLLYPRILYFYWEN
jgi:hypothetical protein